MPACADPYFYSVHKKNYKKNIDWSNWDNLFQMMKPIVWKIFGEYF